MSRECGGCLRLHRSSNQGVVVVEIRKEQLDVLFSAEQLQSRIRELGRQITEDYQGRELHIVAVLKGSFVFLADLVREIDLQVSIDFLGLSSYGASTKTSGVVRMTQDLSLPIEGRDVLVVEDIVDTGLTIDYLIENMMTRQPNSLEICTLLHKPARQRVEPSVGLKYIGFTIPDQFVIGYGLDYAENFRNLPYIGVVNTCLLYTSDAADE